EASDQDVFIAAVILNPVHKTRPFRKCHWFSLGLISVLMARLYSRFFGNPVPQELLPEVAEYLQDKGFYYHLKAYQNLYVQSQDNTVCSFISICVSRSINADISGGTLTPLACIATHLFSVCPNSASCERLFGLLKHTMASLRTRLTTRNLLNIAELHAHLQQSQLRNGEAIQCLKQ
ncbi:hypothetical protein BDY19DRAFT_859013, partial [Irpex rosettiformis]